MKNITHILHFPAFEFYIPDRIMQTVQQERGMDMKQIFVSSTLLWNAGLEEMFSGYMTMDLMESNFGRSSFLQEGMTHRSICVFRHYTL